MDFNKKVGDIFVEGEEVVKYKIGLDDPVSVLASCPMKLLEVIRDDEVTEDGCIFQYEELPTSMFGQKGCEIEPKKAVDKVEATGMDVKMETKPLFKPKRVAAKFE